MCLRVLFEHASVHREHTPLSTVSKLCHACVDFVDSSLLRGYTPFWFDMIICVWLPQSVEYALQSRLKLTEFFKLRLPSVNWKEMSEISYSSPSFIFKRLRSSKGHSAQFRTYCRKYKSCKYGSLEIVWHLAIAEFLWLSFSNLKK